MKIAFLASGRLGLEVLQRVHHSYGVRVVLTDNDSTAIQDYCRLNGLEVFVGNPRKGRTGQLIEAIKIDLLLSVNYLFFIEKDLICWPSGFAINFHGSLLPQYRGRTPHVWAVINNEKKTGITAHLIDEGVDTGAIIDQLPIDIDADDTGAMLLKRYLIVYPDMVSNVIDNVIKGTVKIVPQDHSKATYYHKRTPADGRISWAWQKERIRNWIRAQAFPYPGAFCFYAGTQVTIDKAEFTETGFDAALEDGTILQVVNGRPIVKVSNGAIQLTEIRRGEELSFEPGKKFL